MKKISVVSIVLLSLILLVTLVGCNFADKPDNEPTEINVHFVVDGQIVHTEKTTGKGGIALPPNPYKEGVVFDGWYFDDNTFQNQFTTSSLIGKDLKDDVYIYAKWNTDNLPVEIYFDVTFDSMGGSVVDKQTVIEGGLVTEPTTTCVGFIFAGWYKEMNYVTKWNFDTDTVTEYTRLYAKWTPCTDHLYENDACIYCHKPEPKAYTRVDDDTILFGSYPQTQITDTMKVKTLNEKVSQLPTATNSNGWTPYGYYKNMSQVNYMWYIDIGSGDDIYRGVYFTLYRPHTCLNGDGSQEYSYVDDNGFTASNAETPNIYWFKFEPLSWTILDVKDGKGLIVCDNIIDSQQYDYDGAYDNNYANSTVRKWLNETFYNTAFNDYQKSAILSTAVDNSLASTGNTINGNVCGNTTDNVFLLSVAEFNAYLTIDSAKLKKNTDYAKVQGASNYQGSNTANLDNGNWWLRSPNADSKTMSRAVSKTGGLTNGDVDETSCGIVPAMVIDL